MVGGAEEAFDRALPLFEAMGQLVLHMGPQGHGSTVKLINNTLAAVNAAALAEGISVARQAGPRPGQGDAGGGLGVRETRRCASSSPGP